MWSIVVPVKELSRAKSRLAVGRNRSRLALAFAQDTVAAIAACPLVTSVLIVTNDPFVRLALADDKVRFLDDPGPDLNSAIRSGLAYLRATTPGRSAVLVSDLPSLTTESVSGVLEKAARYAFSIVGDDEKHGTTAVFFRDPPADRLFFGENSREAYLRAGAVPIADVVGISRDVDRIDHLDAAVRLGVGAHTRAALSADPSTEELIKHG